MHSKKQYIQRSQNMEKIQTIIGHLHGCIYKWLHVQNMLKYKNVLVS